MPGLALRAVACGLLTLLTLLATAAYGADVAGIRLWRAPDHTRLVFDLSGPVKHSIFTLENPDRIVIDVPQARLRTGFGDLKLAPTPVQSIRSGVRNGKDLRLVLDLRTQVKPRSFMLTANGELGDRLVVDLYDIGVVTKPVLVAADSSGERDIIIAIDAGHGGEDPGALGPGRLQEKKVVMAIAQRLEQALERMPGYSGVQVRTGDYYIPLQKRRQIAQRQRADLFVSIHADAFNDPRASGSSVYTLSQRGASSASARYLAEKENSADLVGGVNLSDKDDVLASVLLDLSMTASLDASLLVGHQVLRSMGKVAKMHKKQVEQAGFAVLKSPDIPSILIETGFISNPEESRRLNTTAYQTKVADSIAQGISTYFQQHPPAGTLVAAQQKAAPGAYEYVIARGDTLSEIAQRYDVSVEKIRLHNGLASTSIRVGQRIQIPTL